MKTPIHLRANLHANVSKSSNLAQLLATQENPRSLIQELEMRVRMLALQRETAESDTLHAIAGGQQRVGNTKN